jgi:ubiquinol-cytochrome c reductase cytochrome b subunit
VKRLLSERVPPGTGWSFTLGVVLTFALLVEFVTGLGLALYYAPTPDHAWDSIHYISTEVRAGGFLLGLHFWAMRVIVVVLGLHVGRVVLMASYRAPRHTNWVVGVALFLVVLAFAVTGLLLRWDQAAYWATVVRIGIASLTPLAGAQVANLMRGGPDLGALTLTRWYAMHALVLPVVLIALVVAHVRLRVRDGLSGPVQPPARDSERYFPRQAARDLAAVALCCILLGVLAVRGVTFEGAADPTATDYIPRPEWYFAWLFQFVKYFPGRLEALGAIIIPGVALTLFLLLPWLDRGTTRHWRERRATLLVFGTAAAGIVVLTTLGTADQVPRSGPGWNLRELAGAALVGTDRCARCHKDGGLAGLIEPGRIGKSADWVAAHVADPEMIAPGLREAPAASERETQAILAAVAKMRASAPPATSPETRQIALLMTRHCLTCHTVDGVGGKDGPELSHVAGKLAAGVIRQHIDDPKSLDPDAKMPSFATKLTQDEINAIVTWLAAKR